ncbi:hypothetical protein Q7C_672 [Methylophaga frappieri]|uniref:Lipopolysaccharide kinase (Kdo/WaaP) family protein n=1 Tax=Methylophaga frappieri (strain ATCC BAA-2434 / DSM 25690 / JAM7) TaxID=754477 RepID=I1YG00_METFJ|nr:lipopolysaccharide kinase InaA family protein [Methylophaga frappieri]AFJ01843.1 hypothetical protein Q7C_672 [Methylophaga frappieri]
MDLRQLGRALGYVLKGQLALADGHLTVSGHRVPENFAGVGVATNADPATDEYVITQLQASGIKQVRLDFSYGDIEGPASRFLTRLLAENFAVLLHLVQPFGEAQKMKTEKAQLRWQQFVTSVADQFGDAVSAIEIGATSNRRHWSGYDRKSFFHAWRIAHDILRQHRIKMAGPNISDFEPLHNIAVLSRLRSEARLPDTHTNNLFCERVTEPERFDHRIFGTELALKLKVNLVKKARLLKKITDDFGVRQFISPAAFWTLPRIIRLLVAGEQKQADYLTRYFTLLAASGALDQAFWGPLLCSREGLIDEATGTYPKLERITHYRSVGGEIEHYRQRPAFQALTQFNALIPGSLYQGPLATASGIEAHAFRTQAQLIHIIWTINGKAIPLSTLYAEQDLHSVQAFSRDGEQLKNIPEFAGEAPLYLIWQAGSSVHFQLPDNRNLEGWFRHADDLDLFAFNDAGWRGVLLADSVATAAQLRHKLHPAHLPRPLPDNTLRRARNIIWQIDGVLDTPFIAKQPLKVAWQKRFLDKQKPSKARRSWVGAAELLRRGVPTAQPIAYFEQEGDTSQKANLYLCERVAHDFNARQILSAFRDGATEFRGVTETQLYPALSQFLLDMHSRGVFFRDLAGGNILIQKQADNTLRFTLIDINRARFFNGNTPPKSCLSDLARLCHKLHWPGREQLVGHYLQHHRKLPSTFGWRQRLPFYLYDLKVNFKRRYGRKALRNWWRKRRQSAD